MTIDVLKDALLRINQMDTDYQTLEMAMDIAGEALKEAAETHQPDETCRKAFERWYSTRFSNRKREICEHGDEDMLEAWQAAWEVLCKK